MVVDGPGDLFDFVATTGNVSGEGGVERTAMEDEDGERGTVGEETQNSVISDPLTVTHVQLCSVSNSGSVSVTFNNKHKMRRRLL